MDIFLSVEEKSFITCLLPDFRSHVTIILSRNVLYIQSAHIITVNQVSANNWSRFAGLVLSTDIFLPVRCMELWRLIMGAFFIW